MKRMHIHIGVERLEESIRFYNALFGAEPVKTKTDYAKWMLDDPCINFAISTRAASGVDHLGLQVEDDNELAQLRLRLQDADMPLYDEGETVCCYARAEKSWVTGPSGIAWELYKAIEDVQIFSGNTAADEGACCTPESKGQAQCCIPSEKTAACCEA